MEILEIIIEQAIELDGNLEIIEVAVQGPPGPPGLPGTEVTNIDGGTFT